MPPDVGPEVCSTDELSCLPTIPSTPRLLSANPVVSAGPQGPCEPGHWEGIRGPALPCFALLHNGLIKDIPGMTALSKRGQLSSAKGTASHQYCAVPMWGPCIQACPPHVNQPVHPTLDTHRLSHQTQYRFAWPAGRASSQHRPCVACTAVPPNPEARSSPVEPERRCLPPGPPWQGLWALPGGHPVPLLCLVSHPRSPQPPLLAFCGPPEPRYSVGSAKLACFLDKVQQLGWPEQQANFLTLSPRMWRQEERPESPVSPV